MEVLHAILDAVQSQLFQTVGLVVIVAGILRRLDLDATIRRLEKKKEAES